LSPSSPPPTDRSGPSEQTRKADRERDGETSADAKPRRDPSRTAGSLSGDADQVPSPADLDALAAWVDTQLAEDGVENEHFLQEVDRIRNELAPRTPSPPPVRAPEHGRRPEWSEELPEESDGPDRWGAPSPYLEERLNIARSAAARLAREAERAGSDVSGLKAHLETIDRELGRASAELDFVRANGRSEKDLDTPHSPVAASLSPPARAGTEGPPAMAPVTGTYEDFTVARYNYTVSALHRRRRSLGWGTVVVAVGISALLLVLTLRAHEPAPPIWLAGLPLVWMIPVPFFVAAFRGTQRVLKENRLELPEAT
jgi:hypothetical protein